MSENTSTHDSVQTENELDGLTAEDAVQRIHDDVRLGLHGAANRYEEGDAEYEAFRREHHGESADGVIAAHVPTTSSDDAYLHLTIYLRAKAVVVHQTTVASTDTYATYVGDVGDAIPALAGLLDRDYFEVEERGGAIDIIREEQKS